MQLALRPYATVGVALVGASVIAVSPVTVTPTAAQDVRDAAVHLSALENPIPIFQQIFETALANGLTVGQAIAADPAPILKQVLANQLNGIGNIGTGLQNQLGAILNLPQILEEVANNEQGNLGTLAGVGQGFLQNLIHTIAGGPLQDQLQVILNAFKTGDFGTAFNNIFVLTPLLLIAGEGFENLGLIQQLTTALQQPLTDAAKLFPIAAGPLNNVAAVIGVLPNAALTLGLDGLSIISGLSIAAGDTLSGLMHAAQHGDPAAAFKALVDGAAAATTALLNGAFDPNVGFIAGIQSVREAIAAAITPASIASTEQPLALVAKAPSASAKSLTLTVPVEKTPADKGASSGEDASGSGAVSTTDPTTGTKESSTDTASSDKGGNLFTPGSTTKGGRHRADNGPSFGQELKDAATKTIKGLTGLGGGSKSDGSRAGASAGESGSGSSGSSSSSGGSEGK
jgi:hypothetical protein